MSFDIVLFAIRATTVCGTIFAIRHFYDNDRRLNEIHSRALEQVVAHAVEEEFKHKK